MSEFVRSLFKVDDFLVGGLVMAVGVVVFELDPSFTKTGLESSIPTVNFMNSAAFELTRKVHRYSANFSL